MQYSKFRPAAPVLEKPPEPPTTGWVTYPALIVGFALTASLCVLLLLTQSRLSELSFELTDLEAQKESLRVQNEKLQVAHARAYSLERMEQAALELGMIPPAPHQFVEIEP